MPTIPEAILASHTAVLGKTGSGKTSTEKLMVEQVVDSGARVCILDPIKSDWWGVTSSRDGQSPGLPFRILGGPRGHVPLHSSAGAAIGQLVAEGKLPLSIIDMAYFEAGGLQRFFIAFSEALMHHMRGVLYLVVEEAHEFAPKERAGIGGENLALHWAKRLATAGRSKGIRLIVATQRVQSLHNAVLGSCESVVTHRLTTPADQDPVIKWMKANTEKAIADEVAASLSSLPTGTGWLCSGEAQIFEKRAFPLFRTYDNAKTPVADSEEVPVRMAAVDQDELHAIIGEAVKEAEANDPKALKARIAELEKQVKGKAPADSPELEELRAEVSTLTRRNDALESLIAEARPTFESMELSLRALSSRFNFGEILIEDRYERADRAKPSMPGPAPIEKPPRTPRSEPSTGSDRPSPAALAMADLMDRVAPARMTWNQAATLTGRKASGGNFNAARKWLRDSGRIIEEGDFIRSASPDPLGMTRAEAIALWKSVLSNPAPRMIDVLAPFGLAITADQLAETLGIKPTGGNWNNGLAQLRRNGVAELVNGLWRLVSPLPGEAA